MAVLESWQNFRRAKNWKYSFDEGNTSASAAEIVPPAAASNSAAFIKEGVRRTR
jgi:hypothetical protein